MPLFWRYFYSLSWFKLRSDCFAQQGAAVVNSGLLLMAVMGTTFPAVLHFTHTELHSGESALSLSRFSSCIMLVAYASYLFFQLKSQHNLYGPLDEVSLFGSMFGSCF